LLKSNSGTETARSSMRCDRPRPTFEVPSNGQRTGCSGADGSFGQAMTA
jgi:hypothetical protein